MRRIQIWEEFRNQNEPPTESQLSRAGVRRLQTLIPPAWTLRAEPDLNTYRTPDLTLLVADPAEVTAALKVSVGRLIDPKEAELVAQRLGTPTPEVAHALILAAYITPRAQETLASHGINYLDVTGNLRLQLDRPAIYIEHEGATENPWREARALRSLKGPAAARVVRALCDFRPPYPVSTVAARAAVASGTITKILALLGRETLITRAAKGKYQGDILGVNWPQLIRRWTQDYQFETSNSAIPYIDPRGTDALFARLKKATKPYAVTGSFASVHFAPIVQPRLAALYVEDIEQAAEAFSLRQAERGANILLVRPLDPVVFARTFDRAGVTYAALSQVAADLLTGPGRGPQEGSALIDWMKEHEDDWRR